MDTNYRQPMNNVSGNGYAGGGAPLIPPEYAPISMWGYFGYQILFAIPFIGFIVLIIIAIGAKNINLKNFARSYFCLLIIALIVGAILVVTGVGIGILSN